MINWIKNLLIKLNERRKRNIKFRKEFKEKTGVDLNDIYIGGGDGNAIALNEKINPSFIVSSTYFFWAET